MLVKKVFRVDIEEATAVPDRAYTLVHSNFDFDGDHLLITTDNCAQGFLDWAKAGTIGGDNDDVIIESPQYLPIAVQGSLCLYFDDDLNAAEKELSDYEYIYFNSSKSTTPTYKYMIWGTVNVNKTDFYTPVIETKGAVFFEETPNESNFKSW